jgi:hypothetical protein
MMGKLVDIKLPFTQAFRHAKHQGTVAEVTVALKPNQGTSPPSSLRLDGGAPFFRSFFGEVVHPDRSVRAKKEQAASGRL